MPYADPMSSRARENARKRSAKWRAVPANREQIAATRKADASGAKGRWNDARKRLRADPDYWARERDRVFWNRFRRHYPNEVDRQLGRCLTCPATDNGARRFAGDHDRSHCARGCPACYRGLLCDACNLFEGHWNQFIVRGGKLADMANHAAGHRARGSEYEPV